MKYTFDEFESLKRAVNGFNKKVGYNALEAKSNPETGKMWVKMGKKNASETPKQSMEKHMSYSSWWNNLSYEGKLSENMRRLQDGEQEIPLDESGNGIFQKYSEMPQEELSAAQPKVTVLQDIFGVEVQLDSDFEFSGKVVPGKDGAKPTIVINPKKLYEDTVTHEFGHIFIDALGGVKNGRIKAAITQLQGTDLWYEVSNAYPELSTENLAKEVLATALGREAADLFKNDQYKSNWWTRFIEWFNQRMATLLKKDVDYVNQLAKQLFSESNKSLSLVNSDIIQNSKSISNLFKKATKLDKEKLSIEALNKEALAKLSTKVKILKETDNKKYAQKIQQVLKETTKISTTQPLLGLYKFAEFANSSYILLQKKLDSDIEKDKINEYSIQAKRLYSGTFNDIEGYIRVLRDHKKELDDLGITTEELERTLQDLTKNKSEFLKNLSINNTRLAVSIMSKKSNYAQGITKQEIEIEANKLGLKGAEKQQYIDQELIKRVPTFEDINVKYYSQLFDTTAHDISWVESWLLDATNINSHTIQVAHAIISGASTLTRKHTQADEKEIAEAWKKFGGNKKSGKPSEIYKNLYEKGSDGFLYLTSEYKAEFNVQYNKLEAETVKLFEEKGKDSEEYIKAVEKFSDWIQSNLDGSTPIDKWKNPKYNSLTKEERDFLNFSKNSLKTKDAKLKGRDKLITNLRGIKNTTVYKLPSVGQKGMESLYEKGAFNSVKNMAQNAIKKQGDEDTYGKLREEDLESSNENVKSIFTLESGEEKKEIPVFFRTKIRNAEPSADIPSLLVLNSYTVNNYANKKNILPKIEVLSQATGDKKVGKHEGMGIKKLLISKNTGKEVTEEGIKSREYQTLQSIIEDTIYGVNTIDLNATVLGADVNTLITSMSKWTSDSMLMLNYLSGGANLMQGKAMNLIEQLSKGKIGRKALLRGEQMFWGDSTDWTKDIGNPHQTSKTNLLLDLFNVKGDYKTLSTQYFKNNKAKALANGGNLHFLNNMGEYYTASTLMYSLLSEIKVLNKNREFVDKNGKVVKTRGEAASLADVYSSKDGKLQVNFGETFNKNSASILQYTTLDLENKYNEATVSNYIKQIYSELHGQYDSELQSQLQRNAVGKMIMMLRKWMLPGLERRYRGISSIHISKDKLQDKDKFYSQVRMQNLEGNYASAARMLWTMVSATKEGKFKNAYQNTWENMTDYEKANVRKTTMELALMVGALVASNILYNLAKDLDDDERKTVFYTTFYLRRFYSELSFYVNPMEAIKILRTPAATVSMIESTGRLLTQAGIDSWGIVSGEGVERYERGPRKGDPKIFKKATQLMPILKNINRDIESSTEFLYNSF
tara:strand:- start:749 stop:4765 length:4017 start_codon:yes stop_codon:yes gene_type:complete